VAGAGDVNADGFDDVIVGAPLNDVGDINVGRSYIFFGGQDAQADLILTGSLAGDRLGNAVAGAGDVNGDGFDDVLVGVPFNDVNGADKGRVNVQVMNRYRVIGPNGGEIWNVGARRSISWQGSELADVWLSVDGGATYELLESGVGGADVNSIPLRIPHQPTRYARVQITPSDPELTGVARSDSIFTIQSSVALLRLEIAPEEGGTGGTSLSWATEPGVGPDGIAGYRLYRLYRLSAGSAGSVRVGPDLILETSYADPEGGSGSRYQLMAVNGLGEELLLAETASPVRTPLAAWPLPYRGGALNIAFATIDGLGGARAQAEVRIYDLAGRLVRVVARGNYGDGVQAASWDGRDDDGHEVAAGVYFLRSQTGREERRLKLVVVR
jgi:FlgD Ig-like domain/FG-GAP repeat